MEAAESPLIMGAAINGLLDELLDVDLSLRDYPRRPEVEGVADDAWVPLDLYRSLVDHLEAKYSPIVMRRLGRSVGTRVYERSLAHLGLAGIPQAIEALHAAHLQWSRPPEGGFQVVEAREGLVTVRYSAPYNCVLQEGLIMEVARRVGQPFVKVRHAPCRRDGHPACTFVLTW